MTMTTVGFGDFFARTTMGRSVMFLCAMAGVVVVSMVVTVLTDILAMSHQENLAFTVIQRVDKDKEVRQKGAVLVKQFFHLNELISHRDPIELRKVYKYTSDVTDFKNVFREKRNLVYDNPDIDRMDEFREIRMTERKTELFVSILSWMLTKLMKKTGCFKDFKENEKIEKMGIEAIAKMHQSSNYRMYLQRECRLVKVRLKF